MNDSSDPTSARQGADSTASVMEPISALARMQMEQLGSGDIVKRHCPLCGRLNDDRPASRYSQHPWTVRECGACEFVYIDRAPLDATLIDNRAWEVSSKIEDEWRRRSRGLQQAISKKTRWRLHLFPRRSMIALLPRHAEPGPVLDLGCGDGGQMSGLGEQFTPYGIEVSRSLATIARQRFRARGGDVIHATCAEGLGGLPDAFFSAATLRSYLEHEFDPLAVLQGLWRVLRPGGLALVKVPNYGCWNRMLLGGRWCGFRHPDHLNYFTPRTLARIADRTGFDTRFPPGWLLPTGDNMWAVLHRRTISREAKHGQRTVCP